MRYDCIYDKDKDVSEVSQHVAVDLCSAFVNNVIPSQVSEQDLQFGNIDSPNQIIGRPIDVFDAMQLNRVANNVKSKETTE